MFMSINEMYNIQTGRKQMLKIKNTVIVFDSSKEFRVEETQRKLNLCASSVEYSVQHT
jgi:hypothetical protein